MNSADALASYRIPAPEGRFLLPAVSMRCYWALPAYPPPLSFSSCMAGAMVVTYLQANCKMHSLLCCRFWAWIRQRPCTGG